MSRLTRDGTAEPVSRDQILRGEWGQTAKKQYFLCLADHEQDWQPYTVDPDSAISDDHTYSYSTCFCPLDPNMKIAHRDRCNGGVCLTARAKRNHRRLRAPTDRSTTRALDVHAPSVTIS